LKPKPKKTKPAGTNNHGTTFLATPKDQLGGNCSGKKKNRGGSGGGKGDRGGHRKKLKSERGVVKE